MLSYLIVFDNKFNFKKSISNYLLFIYEMFLRIISSLTTLLQDNFTIIIKSGIKNIEKVKKLRITLSNKT